MSLARILDSGRAALARLEGKRAQRASGAAARALALAAEEPTGPTATRKRVEGPWLFDNGGVGVMHDDDVAAFRPNGGAWTAALIQIVRPNAFAALPASTWGERLEVELWDIEPGYTADELTRHGGYEIMRRAVKNELAPFIASLFSSGDGPRLLVTDDCGGYLASAVAVVAAIVAGRDEVTKRLRSGPFSPSKELLELLGTELGIDFGEV